MGPEQSHADRGHFRQLEGLLDRRFHQRPTDLCSKVSVGLLVFIAGGAHEGGRMRCRSTPSTHVDGGVVSRQEIKLNQRPIPEAALRDKDAVEMLRVWIAEGGLRCSIKVGMYRETMDVAEEKAWGTILADVARHVANALESGYASNAEE